MNNLLNIPIPQGLRKVFEMKKKVPFPGMTEIEEKYLHFINDCASKNDIGWSKENHLTILKDLVYIEHLHNEKQMEKYSLKNQNPLLNGVNYFEIYTPDMDEDDPFVTKHDYVLLADNVLKIVEVKSGLVIAKSKKYEIIFRI